MSWQIPKDTGPQYNECGAFYNLKKWNYRLFCLPCLEFLPFHKQIRCSLGAYEFFVDILLKALIEILNKTGYEATNSCQDQSEGSNLATLLPPYV